MVDVSRSNADNRDGKVEVELEAMRKGDFSWHPCKVSLRSVFILFYFFGLMHFGSVCFREKMTPHIAISSSVSYFPIFLIDEYSLNSVSCF